MASPTAAGLARHPHLGAPQPDGWVRVDFHSHTMWSGDSTSTPEEIEQAVVDAGIDVLCITDHNALKGAEELASRLPCRVIIGEEMRTHHGELIGLFLTERVVFGLHPFEAARRIREQGALVYVPHPFDPMRNNMREAELRELCATGLVDAIEVFNAKTSLQSLNKRAAVLAEHYDLPAGAGSDSHVAEGIGAAFVEMPDFEGADDFLAAVRQGVVVGHHWDHPRQWRPRIVPSVKVL